MIEKKVYLKYSNTLEVYFKYTVEEVYFQYIWSICKGCVDYTFASWFFKSKRMHPRQMFLFHFKSSICSEKIQTLEF